MTKPKTTRVACYALVTNAEQKLLLCRLCPKEIDKGKWTLPGGGVEFGEDLVAATVREVLEETGLVVKVTGLADAHSDHFVHSDRELHAVRIVYWAEIVGGDLRAEVDGSTDSCGYFALCELDSIPTVALVRRGASLVRDRLTNKSQ